ncbi:hypothetical protein L249_6796 [Ophiocordyceps polyrhachis-furcata BCC 54312]|uniref:Uncharacterized protein n=1 Tax=Ophiocordyceps polyrhachis-furcata BCC 54312 TaxID=1330021 RepID=A0A367LLL9_9HYPO|nr:hypothetical protein L249_6796 [Ophiocordyceps polyrhachis-furcata BCC 54312]
MGREDRRRYLYGVSVLFKVLAGGWGGGIRWCGGSKTKHVPPLEAGANLRLRIKRAGINSDTRKSQYVSGCFASLPSHPPSPFVWKAPRASGRAKKKD